MTKTTPKTSKTKTSTAKTSTVKKAAAVKKSTAKTSSITTSTKVRTKSLKPKTAKPKTAKIKVKTTSTPKAKTATPARSKPKAKPAAKAAPKKTVSAAKAPAKTKQDLQSALSSLETRMKRADTLTRNSVKALEKAVLALDARTRKDTTQGKSALTRKVNQLSAKLTDMVAQTQTEVNAELKTALNNPTVENLQAALTRADQRLSLAEQSQAAAISKVNRHLSAIATAVDARIEDEAKARLASIAALKAESDEARTALTQRIDIIENDTAQALVSTGDKIEELSAELTHRSEASEISIREKVSEIALQTQTEFEAYRAGLDRRINEMAQNGNTQDMQRLERSIAGLTARLDGLEYAVSHAPSSTPQMSSPQSGNIDVPPAPKLSLVASQAAPLAPTALGDAFTSLSPTSNAAAEVMPNPYLTAESAATPPPTPETPSDIPHSGPVEFDPNNFQAAPGQSRVQTSPPPPGAAPIIDPSQAAPVRDFTEASQTPPPPADLGTLPLGQPYADPAYAEADPTMARVRIGGDTASKFNLPKLSGRNLRVAAIATGVAVVGLVAAKGVFSGNDEVNTPNMAAVNTPPSNSTPVSIPTPNTSIAPIGDYADNKAVEIPQNSDAATTLNTAANAGDKIAQFQLGLSYLEQGRTNEGVDLIRKSANQNQPAAQYRLAKLYEIGEGVSQDSEMARQLTERAAANGNRIAMHDLALYYAEGRGGVTADLPTAAKWFEKAAERGVVDSQFNLGVLFESGQGLPKNVNDAFVWYSIAAGQGDQFAKTRVEVLSTTLDQADLVSAAARAKAFKPVKIDDAANGIFRDVAWAKVAKPAGAQISQIKQAQTMLGELGYEIGGADGSVGPKTRAAIMSFERANSLPETGRINTALIERLELATGA